MTGLDDRLATLRTALHMASLRLAAADEFAATAHRSRRSRRVAATAAALTVAAAVAVAAIVVLRDDGSPVIAPSSTATPSVPDPTAAPTSAPGLPIAGSLTHRRGGCAAVFVFAVSADGDTGLKISVDLPADVATASYPLPNPSVDATLERGTDVGQVYCNDFIVEPYEVTSSSPAASGSVEVALNEPIGERFDQCGVTGTVTITDLVMADGTRVGDLTITSDQFGCYAG